jgi:hypothetical protein
MTPPTPRFPQFEKLFEPGAAEPALRQIERTRQQLSELAARPAPEQARARAAFDAYTRALSLVREVAETRQKMAEESATAAPAAR